MIFYHFVSNPWVVFALKLAAVFIFFLTAPLVLGYAEHKGLAHMQSRLGPMEAGKFHGWAQLIADGVKFIQKEDIVPDAADRRIFILAPVGVIIPVSLVFLVIPFGPASVSCHAPAGAGGCGFWGENFDVGIFFVLAISAISVIGMLMAGWSSANKFSLIGAIRGAAQLIAYELPLVLAASAVAMQAGKAFPFGVAAADDSVLVLFPPIPGLFNFL